LRLLSQRNIARSWKAVLGSTLVCLGRSYMRYRTYLKVGPALHLAALAAFGAELARFQLPVYAFFAKLF